MSGFDVEPDMTRASVLDEKLNALLAGRGPAEGDELASELSWMIEQVNDAFPLPVVSEHVEDTHLALMMEATGELPVPVTAPLAAVHYSLFDRLRAGLARKVAAATLTFTAAFGGAAYAGVLPAPVQEAVSDAAALVGLELPNPTEDDTDRDAREPKEARNDHQPDDALDSGPDGPRSDSGSGSDDDGLGSQGDDTDRDGDDDRDDGDGTGSDDDGDRDENQQEDSDGSGSGDDNNEPDGGDEPDNDGLDGDQQDGENEPDGDEPDSNDSDGGDSSGTGDTDIDHQERFGGSTDSDSGSDEEGASDL